jgi:hypothetical protein
MQTLMVDHMAETVYLFSVKFTFLFLEIELELADLLKYEREMFLMLIYRITVHEQIIEIGMQEDAYKISKDHCHIENITLAHRSSTKESLRSLRSP